MFDDDNYNEYVEVGLHFNDSIEDRGSIELRPSCNVLQTNFDDINILFFSDGYKYETEENKGRLTVTKNFGTDQQEDYKIENVYLESHINDGRNINNENDLAAVFSAPRKYAEKLIENHPYFSLVNPEEKFNDTYGKNLVRCYYIPPVVQVN